jgi:PAS domain S-box-containing protein
MNRLSEIYRSIQGISLKWKLLIPFLFFAFTGTTILTLIGLTSQQNIIRKEERTLMLQHYKHFMEQMYQKEIQAITIASTISENPEVVRLLAKRDRQALIQFLETTYERLERDFNISQFHFHTKPGISFLRLHEQGQYGDDVAAYRKTVIDALSKGVSSACLERGTTGLGIRGVVPVLDGEVIVGSLDIGISFGSSFVEDFHGTWDIDTSLFDISGSGDYQLIATAGENSPAALLGIYRHEDAGEAPTILIAPESYPNRSILFGLVKDCSNKTVALIELSADRSEIQNRLEQTRNLMMSAGAAGTIISFLLTYLVIALFTKPIKEIVGEAEEIALGRRESRLDQRPADEIGSLTNALNTMLEALKKRRMEIEEYARTLERRVQERTSDLLASEEKYRTLVENVPLIVYRVQRDGTTEFVNSYLQEMLGYTIEEAVGDHRFWRDKISGEDKNAYNSINDKCFRDGEDCRLESRVRAKDGRLLSFITHAIPAKDSDGHVKWIDGIMLDITELKRLQERAIQTEEIRTLGEISARMAHEIRNPLSAAGGFARRLHGALENDDTNRKLAGIIVEEVAKLENFVKTLLASIEPFDLLVSNLDLNDILISWIDSMKELLQSRNIRLLTNFGSDLPKIKGDHERLSRSFENILKHAIISTPSGETISISASPEDGQISVVITHKLDRMSADDLEKFFFPHIEHSMEKSVLDLPLAKIIIHRHGGKIDLIGEEDNVLTMRIQFPTASEEELTE